jgi:hypothetical protein
MDSTPINSDVIDSATPSASYGIKMMVILFALFMFVVSDIFTNSILSHISDKAVNGRTPTSWGIVLQGISLVILFSFAKYLNDIHIL